MSSFSDYMEPSVGYIVRFSVAKRNELMSVKVLGQFETTCYAMSSDIINIRTASYFVLILMRLYHSLPSLPSLTTSLVLSR